MTGYHLLELLFLILVSASSARLPELLLESSVPLDAEAAAMTKATTAWDRCRLADAKAQHCNKLRSNAMGGPGARMPRPRSFDVARESRGLSPRSWSTPGNDPKRQTMPSSGVLLRRGEAPSRGASCSSSRREQAWHTRPTTIIRRLVQSTDARAHAQARTLAHGLRDALNMSK